MLWVPHKGVLRVEHNVGAVGTGTPGTAVTTGASASTKGAVAELIAATAFDAYWIRVVATNYAVTATASEGALDIMVGASTERVIIPDLLFGMAGGAPIGGRYWDFPLYIPAGTRLSAKAAGARVSSTLRVAVWLYGGHGYPPFRVGTTVTTYGMGTVPNGTAITPGATGAEGTYTQITASTSRDHFAFVPSFQTSADTTVNDRGYAVDIGIGSATEETIGEWLYQINVNEIQNGPLNPMPAFVDVPSGTRLALRASNSGANDGAYNAVIHAVS
jgi:hypothetical protein